MTNDLASVWERTLPWALPALLVVGFIARLLLIHQAGFETDVRTFEAWTVSLQDNGLGNFYAKTSFADYPPGYFYVLALVGLIWEPFRAHDPSFSTLQALVKLPAILADLGVGALLYAIAQRFTRPAVAFGVAALYVLNPATIFISANWGQVDAIAGGLALLAAFLLLKSDDTPVDRFSWYVPAAWVALAYSLLIKPQAAVVIPVFLAWAFVDRARMRSRLAGTAAGIAAALIFSILLVEPFHPSSPVGALVWLVQRYLFGSSVYPFNSVNAFNLWAIKGPFWQRDSIPIGFGAFALPQVAWGFVLVLAALALIVWRYIQDRTPTALLEACALSLLAFFMLATRMHERYVFDGFLFTIACVPLARRYLWGAVALSIVLLANLIYGLQYLAAVSGAMPGVDASNLWGLGTTFFSLLAVGTFFGLGYAFLGAGAEETTAAAPTPARVRAEPANGLISRMRAYFDPREGLATLRAPLDYVLMGTLGIVSFVLSYVNYWYPADKVFDEIYFARGAEEYLKNLRIYENTHPPLSKLLVTLSVTLFGGLAHGDNSYGWRFLDVLFGAFVVMLLFAFAKRVTGSSVFATIAAGFLLFDGMHFVQSRIATPEGFVVFFSLAAVYAFYRFWIASQVERRRHVVVPPYAFALAVVGSLACGAVAVGIYDAIWSHMPNGSTLDRASGIIVALYVALGAYLAARYLVLPSFFADGAEEQTFPDGSYALSEGGSVALYTPDGGAIETGSGGKARIRIGDRTQNRGGTLQYADDELTIAYRTDPSVTYETPDGTAVYRDNEIVAGDARERGSSATLWLVVFTIALGLLVSTKWYGVMGFGVSFVVLALVWLQRFFFARRPALFGNPRGFRLDGALATIVFIAATVYGLVWVPDVVRQSPDPNEVHNLNEVVYRQYSMFEYHDKLVAKHPYTSYWYEWPFDYVPIAYFYQDHRKDQSDANGCCIEEITSMPNPFIMWFGLLAVPLVGVLAYRERNKAYALIVITYLFQWLPWIRSPRITFAYHFYVDIPLICLCNAIVLQRLWQWASTRDAGTKMAARVGIAAVTAVIVFGFVFFYPILSAQPISWTDWHHRMWLQTWIVGPHGS